MRDLGSIKESNSESDFFRLNLVLENDLVVPFNKSWRRQSNSPKSVSSISTTYTNNLNNFNRSNDIRLSKTFNKNRLKYKNYDNTKILDIVYQVINDLYEEEIVPSIHEIRRKLNKNKGLSIGGQNLLKICSGDERFKTIRLQSSIPVSKDVQNEWAILVKNRPFNHFNKDVDIDLLKLVSNYLVFISSYRYHKLTNDILNNSNNNVDISIDIDIDIRDINMIPAEHIFNIGGRYLFAEHLKMNGPYKLRNLPLGTIVNLIQKLNEIGILAYKGNCLVPVSNSKSATNKFILNLTKSFNKGHLDDVKKKFISLFDSGSKIPLSSLPIVYKRRFGEELNYIEIGYERLSDFIKNEIPTCKITNQSNQIILSIPTESDISEEKEQQNQVDMDPNSKVFEYKSDEDSTQNSIVVYSNNLRKNQISQFDLNPSNVTVLYPLKITKI